jgi:hypothetical protein
MMRFLLYTAVVGFLAVPAQAQSVKLEIQDGRVNLDATGAPAGAILAEWARVGGTKVVGAEKITGAPLTLKLVDTPERQALDIILRSVAGYMAAPRLASAAAGASAYDRILILPTSSTPTTTANANTSVRTPSNPAPVAGNQRRVPPRPPGMPTADSNESEAPQEVADGSDTGVPAPPVFTFPQANVPPNQIFAPVPQPGFVPGQPGAQPGVAGQPGAQPGFVPAQPGANVAPPAFTLQPAPNGAPNIYNFVPNNGQPPAATNLNGFQVIGSPTPGMVQQPVPVPAPGQPVQPAPGQPVQPAPGQPVQPTRPPGRN